MSGAIERGRAAERASVVVVGAGVAGTAAAITAARAGGRVTIVDGGTGASTLATGAIDVHPWEAASPPEPLAPPALAALDALGAYSLPSTGARVATTAGVVRPARGLDRALLDVASLDDAPIGVVQSRRPGWDARALARAWGDRFRPLEATLLRYVDETVLPDADFAARHDDDARLGWLSERLREAAGSAGRLAALLLPPSLGVDRARAARLTDLVGVRCGEASAAPGGPAGLRFEHARDRALAAAGVERLVARVAAIEAADTGWRVRLDGDPRAPLESGAVVLAIGGFVGGGLEYRPPASILATAVPPAAHPAFHVTVQTPALRVGAGERPLDLPSTLFGAAPESLAWPFVRDAPLDRVGVLVDAQGGAAPGLFCAGEIVADRPRTWLDALTTGAAAGAAAERAARAAKTPG